MSDNNVKTKPEVITKKTILAFLMLVLIVAIVFYFFKQNPCTETSGLTKVRYGITPYQDSALPVVANELGWYKESGIDFELIPLAWGDVITALSSGVPDTD